MSSPAEILEFGCPHCGAVVQASAELAGERIQCARCQKRLKVPGARRGSTAPPNNPYSGVGSRVTEEFDGTPESLSSPPLIIDPAPSAEDAEPAVGPGLDGAHDEMAFIDESAERPPMSDAAPLILDLDPEEREPAERPWNPVAGAADHDEAPIRLDNSADDPIPFDSENEGRGNEHPGIDGPGIEGISFESPGTGGAAVGDEAIAAMAAEASDGIDFGLDELSGPIDLFGSSTNVDAGRPAPSGPPGDEKKTPHGESKSGSDKVAPIKPEDEFRMPCPVCDTACYPRFGDVGRKIKCPDCFSEFTVVAPPLDELAQRLQPASSDDGDELRVRDPEEIDDKVKSTSLLQSLDFDLPDQPPVQQRPPGSSGPANPATPAIRPVVVAPASSGTPIPAVSISASSTAVAGVEPDERPERRESISVGALCVEGLRVFNSQPMLFATFTVGLGLLLFLTIFTWGTTHAGRWIESKELMSGFITLASCILGGVVGCILAIGFGVVSSTIVQNAASGEKKIRSWPEYDFLDWLVCALYFYFPSFVACIPGGLIVFMFLAVSGHPVSWSFLMLSYYVVFPFVMISALLNGSPMMMLSKEFFQSIPDQMATWTKFLVPAGICTVLGVLCVAGIAMRIYWLNIVVVMVLVPTMWFYLKTVGVVSHVVGNRISTQTIDSDEED